MKKILFTLMAVFLSTAMYSQYYYVPYKLEGKNPREVNTEGENPYPAQPAGWTKLWNGGTGAAVEYTDPQNIPFSFNFDGEAVTQYKVSSAGFVTFSVDATENLADYKNESLPSASVPDKSVAVLGIKPIQSTSGTTTYNSAILTKTFGTAPNRQHWIQFNYYGDPNISQGWTYWSVVLEESTNYIYIVDMKTLCVTNGQICTNNVKLSAGVQTDATTADMIAGSPNLGAASIATNVFTSADNSYYKFVPGARPTNDLEAMEVVIDDVLVLKNAPFTIGGLFLSAGADAVTNFDFAYQIDNGTPVIGNVTTSIPTNTRKTVNHPTKWTPTAVGKYTITIWPSQINGAADEVSENDKVSFTVSVVNRVAERTVLHEVFTSSTCGPCRPGNENTDENIFPERSGFTVIKYQQNFPGTGDPYATKESVNRRGFYNVNAIPNMQVDGGWNGNAQQYTVELFDKFKAEPAFIELDAKHTLNWKTINVSVNITPLVDFENPNLRLFIAVNEKHTDKNVKTNGESEFFHVMKKMIPNENGTAIGNLTSETKKSFNNLSYEIPGPYKLPINGQTANQINLTKENSIEEIEDLEVVVFVQDIVTKEVFQSAYSEGFLLGVNDKAKNVNTFRLFPNPANNEFVATMKFDKSVRASFKVFNILGQEVSAINEAVYSAGNQQVKFDAAALLPGVYYVNMLVDGQQNVQKIVIAH